jgi:hypothetical protein
MKAIIAWEKTNNWETDTLGEAFEFVESIGSWVGNVGHIKGLNNGILYTLTIKGHPIIKHGTIEANKNQVIVKLYGENNG